jgi:asparagine synthase (glutamine-hydrolysing)
MCGFFGYFGKFNISKLEFEKTLRMGKYRGPDNTSIVSGDNFMLGFNRLSIIDLSENGNQPKSSVDNLKHIVFNGEIYNYKKLKVDFVLTDCTGNSDTEVLFNGLIQNDIFRFVEKLEGMFSIAYLDLSDNKLYLIRDFAGIKPLYYYLDSNGVIISSQLDQIIAFKDQINLELNEKAIFDYYSIGSFIAPNTIFQNIFQVNPGELVVIDLATITIEAKRRFYYYSRNMNFINSRDYFKIVESSIGHAVKNCMDSDVPMATLLSGGIDSPLISYYVKKFDPKIRAFIFKNNYSNYYDESESAEFIAEKIGIERDFVSYNNDTIKDDIIDLMSKMPEPIGDFGIISYHLLTSNIPDNIKVLFGGDGGDELFYGYNRHRSFIKYYFILGFHNVYKRCFNYFLKLFGFEKIPQALLRYTKFSNAYRFSLNSIEISYLERIFKNNNYSICDKTNTEFKTNKETLFTKITEIDFYIYLQSVLRKVDLISMLNSKEVRVPFLMKSVLEVSRSYNPLKYGKFELKKILKDLFRKLINFNNPQRKIGFTLPISQILKGSLKNEILNVVNGYAIFGSSVLNDLEVRNYVNDYFLGKHQDHKGIWHIYALQRWAIQCNLI